MTAYTLLVDVESSSGDGKTLKFTKGSHTPKNEYEELLLNAAVSAGFAKAPKAEED